ncbi:hypothetical protein [Borreliella lanei]|uniref:Uncharacterized protein n=1 Tax=Borreliella lanei TaxID=373540 RepID=A0A7W9ZBL1_9SPIR|nr:hypothetical protein [Borreliella lanei]MBB6208478.1 hypothetical protein [Borreliella lanei]
MTNNFDDDLEDGRALIKLLGNGGDPFNTVNVPNTIDKGRGFESSLEKLKSALESIKSSFKEAIQVAY